MLFNPYIWGDGGGEPAEPEVLIKGYMYSSVEEITNILVGGEIYEPQS